MGKTEEAIITGDKTDISQFTKTDAGTIKLEPEDTSIPKEKTNDDIKNYISIDKDRSKYPNTDADEIKIEPEGTSIPKEGSKNDNKDYINIKEDESQSTSTNANDEPEDWEEFNEPKDSEGFEVCNICNNFCEKYEE